MAKHEQAYERLGAKVLTLPAANLAEETPQPDKHIPAAVMITAGIGASLVTLAVDQWWPGLFALPNTPHYFSLFAWGSTFGGFALAVLVIGFASTFVTRASRSASSELSDLTKSTA